MASNTVEKQKDKLIQDVNYQKQKIEDALKSLKESVVALQEGEDGSMPYWNGENAYHVVSNLLSYVDNGYALMDYVKECENSLKKTR